MMTKIKMSLKENSYEILIGQGILPSLGRCLKNLNIGQDAFIISNPIIMKHHGAKLIKGLKLFGFNVKVFNVASGEKSKSVQTAFKLLQEIAREDVFKKPFIIAFGGGVVGDLAGFLAAIYKRGIPYVQVPTTLLAQVDSAIGGKVAVDLPVGKNLVGAFFQPKIVFSDVTLLKTLDQRQIKNGMAEIIKYGVIYDQEFFNYVLKNYQKVLSCDLSALKFVVARSSQIKTNVVLADEKETKGIRTILNFGHTMGHAIESASKYGSYHHGEAIGLGMRVAAEISVRLRYLPKKSQEKLNELLTLVGLPVKISNIKISDILNLMRHDKKFVSGRNRFVLATSIGKVKVVENIPQGVIVESIKKYM